MTFDLIKQSYVQGEAEPIPQVDLVGQRVAEFAGRGGRVGQESLCGSVHERHRKHDGLLGFGGLRENNEGAVDDQDEASGTQRFIITDADGFV